MKIDYNLIKNLAPTVIVILICSFFYVSTSYLYKKDIDELHAKLIIVEKQNITSIVDRATLNVKTDLITENQKDKLNRILDSLQRIEEKLNVAVEKDK
jgi:hypothetical protein